MTLACPSFDTLNSLLFMFLTIAPDTHHTVVFERFSPCFMVIECNHSGNNSLIACCFQTLCALLEVRPKSPSTSCKSSSAMIPRRIEPLHAHWCILSYRHGMLAFVLFILRLFKAFVCVGCYPLKLVNVRCMISWLTLDACSMYGGV